MSTPLAALEESRLRSFHWRMVFTAGMGFFTDAYDLFIIGVVTTLLSPLWHLKAHQLALLNGVSLAAAAVGAIIFGMMADRFGRKKMYGLEVVILFFGALLSASATSFWWLVIARAIVGLGIGGDYPSSAVIATEHANRKNRGFLVLMVFAMQALGLTAGPLLASLLIALPIPHEWVWRILLGLGALPAASVFYLRRKIQETPRFLLTKRSPYEVSHVVSNLVGISKTSTSSFKTQRLWSPKWVVRLIGTAGAWFLLDVVFYGNSISSLLILKTLNPTGALITNTLYSALMFLIFAVPGYFLAAWWIDRLGRKTLQYLGFFMIGAIYLTIGLFVSAKAHFAWFLLLFGISFFFINFGPNTTTFLVSSEVYPTNLRAKAHGLSAAIGKIGAFVGAFLLPIVLETRGVSYIFIVMGIVSFCGMLVTSLVPEMRQQSLDETETLEPVGL